MLCSASCLPAGVLHHRTVSIRLICLRHIAMTGDLLARRHLRQEMYRRAIRLGIVSRSSLAVDRAGLPLDSPANQLQRLSEYASKLEMIFQMVLRHHNRNGRRRTGSEDEHPQSACTDPARGSCNVLLTRNGTHWLIPVTSSCLGHLTRAWFR